MSRSPPPFSQATSTTNLFIGNLTPDIGTEQLRDMFEPFGDIEQCRVMFDMHTNATRGFGFVKYCTPDQASYAIQCMHNFSCKDGTNLLVKFANASEDEPSPSNNLFVKGLPPSISTETVKALFAPYGSVIETKILTDALNGNQSRGQALVRLSDVESATKAINGLNGSKYPGTSKGITVKYADSEHSKIERRQKVQRKLMAQARYSPYGYLPPPPSAYAHHHSHSHSNSHVRSRSPPVSPSGVGSPSGVADPNNLYIYHLPIETDDALLYRLFSPYGAIQSVKVGRDPATGLCKGYGFVRMVSHADAWAAVNSVNGQKCGGKMLTVSFKK